MIVITGPTGSGKTTTLATMLSILNKPTRKILTIEDPVEYEIAGVNQSQVKPSIGLTFAAAMRAFVRQDPDVIMVGEIRDAETANIAIHAALTGHLVLTTLHTETAAAAVPRLLDLGVEGFLLKIDVARGHRAAAGARPLRSLQDAASTLTAADLAADPRFDALGFKAGDAVYEAARLRALRRHRLSRPATASSRCSRCSDEVRHLIGRAVRLQRDRRGRDAAPA